MMNKNRVQNQQQWRFCIAHCPQCDPNNDKTDKISYYCASHQGWGAIDMFLGFSETYGDH